MAARVDRASVSVMVIDVQPFFVDLAFPDPSDAEPLMTRLEHLLMLSDWMDLPTVVTYEIPTAGNGGSPERLERAMPETAMRFDKDFHGSLSEPEIREAFDGLGVRQVAVAGAETDVCVLQTVLGLLDAGFEVFLLEDCLFTTEPHPGPALRRMEAAGAVPTTLKAFAYELTARVTDCPWFSEGWAMGDHPDAKPLPDSFIPPEKWPPWNPVI